MSIKRGLTIGIPTTGQAVPFEWAWTLGQLRLPMNVDTRWERTDNTEIGEARCELAERARLHGSQALFFLDHDVVPPLNALKLLWQALDEHPDAAIIGGVYTDKDEPTQPMVFDAPGCGPYWDWSIGDVFRVGFGVATGCSLINVALLDSIPRPWFGTVDEPGERWTEDMYFCRAAREAGHSVYVHGGILCRHYDLRTGKCYSLSPQTKPFRKFYTHKETTQ